MTALAVRARGLRRSFRKGTVRALDGVSIDVHAGATVSITGPSGSGKTTLLHALAGLLPVDEGEVQIHGRTPKTSADWVRVRRQEIGLIFQDDWLLPALTAAENVEIAMQGTGGKISDRRARALALLDRLDAGGLAHRPPGELSGGERQKIAVARGLANRPRMLFADEPTGELDSENAQRIVDLLFDLHRQDGLTLLIVTHDPTLARRCALRFETRDGRGEFNEKGAAI
jgi:ABC-type lipoprotein export system ATPase subunit